MSKKIVCLLLSLFFICFIFSGLLNAQEIQCKNIANYQMNVKLDTKNKGITGEETLTWINDSDVDIVELYFHLYYNAFKNNKSTFMQELQKMGRFRRLPRNEEEYGYCDVQSISILPDGYFEETDLTPTIEFVQPDDNNPYDQTVMKVTLPKPLPPGDTIKVYIKFYSKVPRTIARSGYYRDYYFIAQWFPKIGVFWEGKWNCHQYHATSEFFSDFGTYDVNITVPKDFKIGATGIKRKETPNVDGTITYNFYQENVHGFVWTASPDYIQMVEKFSEPPLREVDITLLIMPEHKKQAERYFKATKAALKYYGSWYGEYPYSHITVVDPAFRSGAGGMEYPTLFTGGTSWLTAKKVQRPEGVTVHECGHQFWYHLVANNEFEDAWLDEGFNTYSTAKCLDAAYGDNFYMRRYFQIPYVFDEVNINQWAGMIGGYLPNTNLDVITKKAWEFQNSSSYGINSYSKPAMMLRTLENFLGEEIFARIIKTYSLRWRYKHPRPQAFINVVNEITGKDISWFFDQFLNTAYVLDYAVGRVSSKPISEKQGIFDKNGEKVFLKGIKEDTTGKEKIYETDVIIQRKGEIKIPVEIVITFDNGEKEKRVWDGQYRWTRYTFRKPAKWRTVQVDPEHKLVIDINYTNNSRVNDKWRTPAVKWATRWLFWFQHLLETFTFFS